MKIFSHRGYVQNNIKENSIKSLEKADLKGYNAIEFDIWFLKNQLILSHDRPRNLSSYSNLEEFLAVFKNKFDYWIDFKNLNPKNSDAALKLAKEICKKLKINNSNLYFAPFITSISKAKPIYSDIRKYFGKDARILAVCEKLPQKNYQKYHQILKENNIYGLSIKYKNINKEFMEIFSDLKIFAWTVNDKKTAEHLKDLQVKIFTSDKITPKDL